MNREFGIGWQLAVSLKSSPKQGTCKQYFLIIQIKTMKVKQAVNTLATRMQKPTPRFFQKLRNIGVAVAAIAGTLLAAPVALPAVLVKVAGYLAVAGGVMGTVSQTAVKNDK